MQIAGGYAPTNTAPNKKLYNAGSEWQDDVDGLADYYSTFYREYDPVIGRFNGVDPVSASFESWTTYHYSYNNPVNFNDPMGDLPQGDPNYGFKGGYEPPTMRGILDAYAAAGNPFSGGFYDPNGGGSGGFGAGMTDFDFYSTYAGMKIRLANYGIEGLKYGTNKKMGEFGFWQSLEIEGGGYSGVSVGTRFTRVESNNNGNSLLFGLAPSIYDVGVGSYGQFIHNHTTYKTTQDVIKNIYLPNGAVRSARAGFFATGSKLVKSAGVLGSLVTTGVSAYNIYSDIEAGQTPKTLDIADATVGTVGLLATAATVVGLISNPVGWAIGTGVLLYSGARLLYDIFK